MGDEEPRQSVSREMSDRSGFFEAIRMKRRDSGMYGITVFSIFWGGFTFMPTKSYRPFLSVLLIMGIIHNKKLEMKGLKLFL